jgi:hypothetical protein
MTPTRLSTYLWVAAPSLNLNGGMAWLSNTSAGIIRKLLWDELTGADLLWTFVGHNVQPLR